VNDKEDKKTKKAKEQKQIQDYLARRKNSINRPYQGGAPGLTQTRISKFGARQKKYDFVYPGIKKQLKDKHKHINIVFMQGWRSEYIVAEEDAELIHKIDKNKEYHQISYFRTSIKRKEKKDFINELHKENKGYAFLDRIKNTNPVMRIVVDSSDKKLIGEKY
tara:strand:- start:265 stop:753 length:489 start_codon:yes stop_codon:yes gene_type:complete